MATQCFDVKATNTFVFLCFSYVILSWQVNGNLLDPMLIGNELQKFARDALGADEMQVVIILVSVLFMQAELRVIKCFKF